MITLGLTGSIGMGKSTTAQMLRHMNISVHDSDTEVHNLLAHNPQVIREVIHTFPKVKRTRTGAIDRKSLGKIIFKDPAQKQKLEAILHPEVRKAQQRFLRTQRHLNADIAVLDIPLLYETGADARVDYVMVVSAPPFIQRLRVMRRPNMTEESFRSILDAQMPDHEKRKRADVILPTGLGRSFTMRKLKSFLSDISNHRR